jgi:anion-transporting  ArsA/GET3 family ATPase
MNPEQIIRELIDMADDEGLVDARHFCEENVDSDALSKLTEKLRGEMERFAANQVREALRRRRSD